MSRFAEKPESIDAEAQRARKFIRAKPCPRGCKRMPGLDCRNCLDRARAGAPETR